MEFTSPDLQAIWDQYGAWVLSGTLKAIGAFIVLIIGLRLAKWLGRMVRDTAHKQDALDNTIGSFAGSVVQWVITAAVVIATLQVFGVQATSFVAILGAMTLAIGLSLQGALGNIASGVMIMLFRPYKIDDFIELAGVKGTVRDINLFQTVLARADNVKIMVPNTQAISGVIKNYSGYPTRRIDTVFSIDYADDMDKAQSVIKACVTDEPRILAEPEPFIHVTALSPSSVDITVRVWVAADDYSDVLYGLTKTVKTAIENAGLSIPYPHTVIVQK
ncbi:MAG: mechanosensitive ion channel domain-containing protein [Hyphomonadaceae bacterium]